MEIISVIPRGYCQGVVRAIKMAQETAMANPGKDVYMLGMIVHNTFVVNACKKMGIKFIESPGKTRLELMDEIENGIVIFTAHGVSDEVRKKALAKKLEVVDATCPYVERTHTLVKSHNGDVIYIGKKNHPEAEGTVNLGPHIHLVSSVDDVERLDDLSNVMITCQTTLSLLDMRTVMDACLRKYPNAIMAPEICNATRIRQEAVMNLHDVDCLIVVGDSRSNNSRQLALIAEKVGIQCSYLIDSALQLQEYMVQGKERIAVTSGSSTPNDLTAQVISILKEYEKTGVFTPAQEVNCKIL